MPDPTTQSTKAPWHLWVVGGLAVLWNCVGVVDFTMSETRNEAYLKAFTPEQLAYFNGFPIWAVAAWGLGTWGGFLGSVGLLLRRKLAVQLFAASLVGVVLTNLYNYVLSDGLKVAGEKAMGAVIFSAVIFVIGVLLWAYARAMRKRGVLR